MIIYNKTIWENNKTPINADNLQKIEDGIEYLFDINREVPEAENLRVQAETKRELQESLRKSNEVDRDRRVDENISKMNSEKANMLSALDNKFEEVDNKLNTKLSEIENRFLYLTSTQQQDSEVIDARIGVDGTRYTSLKERIDNIESKTGHTENTNIDLSNYYTKTQTDNKISEEIAKAQLGGSGEVDLSAYATKTFVNEEIAKIEVGDKHTHSNLSVLNNITQTKVNEWNGKANASHTHTEYANKTHTHTEYAPSSHTHNYASASHTHSDYANKTHTHSTSDISNLSNYISDLITNNAYVNSLKNTIDTLSSELAKVKTDIEALKNNSGSNGGGNNGGSGNEGGGSSSSNLKTDKTSYTINSTEMLEISYTTSASIPSSCAWELRQNGSYLCSAYRDTSSGKIVCYTGGLSIGTHNNITLVAKEYQTDIAVSNVFSITVSGSSSGGNDSGSGGSGGESTPPSNNSDYDTRVLSLMYPMPQSHECVPNGAPSDWKYQSRWENKDKPAGWSAFGGWAQVYRVDGTPFTQNTGVEIKNYKVFGWKNGQWHSVVELPYVTGSFYAEDFTDDANSHFSNSIKPSDDRSSVIIKLTSDMTVSTSQGTKNVCYHPFTAQLDYDANFEYIFTCVSMRKVKWDANGVDDRNTTRYCASCGGDWWRQKGLTWAPDWSNNKGIAQPKITEVTTEWQVFSMTTVPQGWSNGFPK